ncbi:hypothetical protein KIW84_022702 [Lathyrus oleraceus]|uniref:Uncharacterized protein n=1 Tax=Pisum sativum TaxID=3888 RepID=A0A9D4YD48_PEA|nr:hypothetical protein KIW84_022702 [Pisum sativum]
MLQIVPAGNQCLDVQNHNILQPIQHQSVHDQIGRACSKNRYLPKLVEIQKDSVCYRWLSSGINNSVNSRHSSFHNVSVGGSKSLVVPLISLKVENAVIAYNNRPAAEAIPYFEQLGPAVSQMMPIVETNPILSLARSAQGDA